MNKNDCCNNDCGQGDYCPHRKPLDITTAMLKYYFVISNIPKLLLIATGLSLLLI